jgi:uracil-DNA glycosylase
MRASQCLTCTALACADVDRRSFVVPGVDVPPEAVSIVMVSEAAPGDPAEYYYSGEGSLFERTTVEAFRDAGTNVRSIRDLVDMGVYFTTAVKCGKTGYGIAADTIGACSLLLERELALFPSARVLMLMGDVAIRSVNAIARRENVGRVIPAGPTYLVRGRTYEFHGMRVLPSYLQAGPAFFIERSKRRMIAEDIATALRLAAAA